MDPFSAMAVACNVLDLIGLAVKCVVTTKQVYSSVDGRKYELAIVNDSAQNMQMICKDLQEEQSQLGLAKQDEQLKELVLCCVTNCEELEKVLAECTSKPRSLWGAGKTTLKLAMKSGRLDELGKKLDSCRQNLNSLISLRTK